MYFYHLNFRFGRGHKDTFDDMLDTGKKRSNKPAPATDSVPEKKSVNSPLRTSKRKSAQGSVLEKAAKRKKDFQEF